MTHPGNIKNIENEGPQLRLKCCLKSPKTWMQRPQQARVNSFVNWHNRKGAERTPKGNVRHLIEAKCCQKVPKT